MHTGKFKAKSPQPPVFAYGVTSEMIKVMANITLFNLGKRCHEYAATESECKYETTRTKNVYYNTEYNRSQPKIPIYTYVKTVNMFRR